MFFFYVLVSLILQEILENSFIDPLFSPQIFTEHLLCLEITPKDGNMVINKTKISTPMDLII
jgi:hypothetical protein